MDRRLQLQLVLEDLLGSRNVYFQPPSTVKMKYPCIVYTRGEIGFRTNLSNAFANDKSYSRRTTYTVTAISQEPDSPLMEKILSLEYCTFQQNFATDGLNHDVFILIW